MAFYIRPPRPGAYKLLVYAKQREGVSGDIETASTASSAMSGGSGGEKNLYGAICEYRLMARVPATACLPPFPPCQTGNYGPTEVRVTL